MYFSQINILSLRHHPPWLTLCIILVNLCGCQSQYEQSVRRVAPPYRLSFNISQVSGSSMTYGPDDSIIDGKLYRTLAFHNGTLFVGGEDQLFSASPKNLAILGNVSIPANSSLLNLCQYDCNNYIGIIHPLSAGVLLECGTNYLSPYCQQRSSQNLTVLGSRLDMTTGNFIAPSVPLQNNSWLLLRETDSDYQLYAATNLRVSFPGNLLDPAIVKANLTTTSSETMIDIHLETLQSGDYVLNSPQFVGDPIEYNERIYFFFREFASEHINGGRIVYSRVARVCKNETGGDSSTIYDGKFVTFMKARLECSIDGDFPYHYNEIQDIHQSTVDQNVVFAIFDTAPAGVASSAVCAYRLDEIETLFYTSWFRVQVDGDTKNLWNKLNPADEPIPRQETCPSSTSYSNDIYANIKTLTQLLNEPAENKLHYESTGTSKSNPLLVSSGERFSQIVVDEDVLSSIDVMFIGTENGTVLKAYLNENRSEARIVEEISLNTDGLKKPVLRMLKSDQALFVGTDVGVFKIPLQHCQDYTTLEACLDSRDPYCKWVNDTVCTYSTADGMQDLENGSAEISNPNASITFREMPISQNRTTNISNQPVNMYLVAEATSGNNLRVFDDEVNCDPCAPLLYTQFKSISSGNEIMALHIDGSSNETMNCSCSCTLAIDGDLTISVNFTLTVDDSMAANATEKDKQQLTYFDNKVIKYEYERNVWLKKVEAACEVENVRVTSTCP